MTEIVHKIIDKSGITKKLDDKLEYMTYMLVFYTVFLCIIDLV